MKQKIYVLVMTLVLTIGSLIVPQKIDVEAKDYGDPEIDHGYIYNLTKDLSNITFQHEDYWNKSRYFGTPGEEQASTDIKNWMNFIGLENVKKE